MGMNAMQFGRNFPPAETHPVVPPEGDPEKNIPNPRDISNLLLAREEADDGTPRMILADGLNLLAAAWIQFQNHGWFAHRIPKMAVDSRTGNLVPVNPQTGEPLPFAEATDFIHIPLRNRSHPLWDPKERWTELTGQKEMRIHITAADPTRQVDASYPPTYRTTESHWWSASQIYGPRVEIQRKLRSCCDGKLNVVEETLFGVREILLPLDPDIIPPPGAQRGHAQGMELGVDMTGLNDHYWVGTSLLHTLFVREHNYLCDQLKTRYRNKLAGLAKERQDEWLFEKARLIVAAMMAKIHTIEWTTAILNHPALQIDMNSNWWGVLGRWFKIHFGRASANEGISGIIGSQAEHHAAPYSLTEDFVAVYRLHPLIPDVFEVHELLKTGNDLQLIPFRDLQGAATRGAIRRRGMTNWIYSFAKQSPGAVTLRNYPKSLREFERITGERLDLATRDIVRDRERGVPTYNRFRSLLRMRPMKTYKELVGHRPDGDELVKVFEKLYGQDGIDRVDLMVGLLGEKVPPGFGFSDTAFRIFILMASRRLKSDRFFTDDFRPEVYTQFGIDWVNEQTMSSMLERHYKALLGKIPAGRAVFARWS